VACTENKGQTSQVDSNACVFDKSNKVMANTYPFDTADEIQIVSYPKSRKRAEKYDDVTTRQILLEEGKYKAKGIKETIALSKEKWQTLFSLLYDYQTAEGKTTEYIECYTPKHAILFLQNKKVIAYLEISLECNDTRQSKNVEFGTYCTEKMCMLQKFFKENGIKLGFKEGSCK